ncbi:CT20-domain-containing protein [Massarina eburnea CBS 473.64]|uniref:CT20-domain-containing protein n=1 Tax=Massarina eburnea CBS 473.64 TaxID=1395130 RepID=A0A6A6RW87_9PLEO|nr:CT20-domain-containing protein [Massarina eburnea CBS 473.64]
MPPRKKARASAASTPLADTQPKTPQDTTGTHAHDHDHDHELLNDGWADEQETQLFKSMMKWKPTGIHKHFRMISIHADMRSHGFAADDAAHTRIPGIWRKLDTLYDLRALDERENAYAFSEEADPLDPSETAHVPEFELPEYDFGDMMWRRRFHSPDSAASSSPPLIPIEDDKALFVPDIGLLKDLPDGVLSQKAESVAEATPTPKKPKTTRSGRAAVTNKTSRSKGQAQGPAKSSKAQSADEEEDDDEDEDVDDDESSDASEEDTAPSTRRTVRATGRSRTATKRTRKR